MLERPVALVTGGSRGIGRGICQELARAGYGVAINYHSNEAAALQTKQSLGGTPTILCPGDVAIRDYRDEIVDTVLKSWGRIDALVNNAGITSPRRADILEATEEAWDDVIFTNLTGPFFLTQRVVREMIRLGDRLTRPTIVNVTSISAVAVSVNRGDYCVSKAGLSMATKLWAVRTAGHGIRVFEVRPGIIETDMTAAVREKYDPLIAEGLTPIRRWGTPEDVGRAVASLVTGAIPFSTGDVLHVDGGLHIPRL